MKKSIITATILLVAMSSSALEVYRMKIPNNSNMEIKPKENNSNENDDESIDFGGIGGGSITPPQPTGATINSFTANPVSYFNWENVILSWNVNNAGDLNIYDDNLLTNHIANVSGMSSYSINPTGDNEYYLDAIQDTSSVRVYEYIEQNRVCDLWTPDESTVGEGLSFNQTRDCTVDYASSEPSTRTINSTEERVSTGTMVATLPVGEYGIPSQNLAIIGDDPYKKITISSGVLKSYIDRYNMYGNIYNSVDTMMYAGEGIFYAEKPFTITSLGGGSSDSSVTTVNLYYQDGYEANGNIRWVGFYGCQLNNRLDYCFSAGNNGVPIYQNLPHSKRWKITNTAKNRILITINTK